MLLIHGANPNLPDNLGKQTPLHLAAIYGDFKIASLLIHFGADVNARDSSGETPLHSAVWGNIERHKLYNHIETASLIIQAGADINALTNDGLTPLSLAMRHKDYRQMHDFLLQLGAK